MTTLNVSGAELIGQKLVEIRPMTDDHAEQVFGDSWRAPCVLVFEDGSIIYASRDDEGNGGGAMFGELADGTAIRVDAWES